MWTEEQEREAVQMIEHEMNTRIKERGKFVDGHQGYAVILEEVEEAEAELEGVKAATDALKKAVFQENDEIAFSLADSIYRYAKNGMLELMQVAAMAGKYMESFKVVEDVKETAG